MSKIKTFNVNNGIRRVLRVTSKKYKDLWDIWRGGVYKRYTYI